MRNIYLQILLALLFFGPMRAQENTSRVSLSLEGVSITEALERIEDATDQNIYFDKDWNPNTKVTGNYYNELLTDVLGDILKGTNLNHFIWEGSVYITRNNLIVDGLPEDFFNDGPKGDIARAETLTTTSKPIFIGSQSVGNNTENIETVRVGRQREGTGNTAVLSGKAVLASTGQPARDMAVLVEGMELGVSTDSTGYYELRLPKGEHLITTRALGIAPTTKRVLLFGDGNMDLELQESVEALEEVVVAANQNRNVEQAVTGLTQLDVQKIKTLPLVMGERDLLNAAVTLPGIAKAGEGAAGYNVRGGRTDQNLILLDNAVIYNPVHFFGIFSALNPYTTGNVDIYKGNIPVEYGGRLSSVFDIQTKDGNSEEFSGEASIGPVTNSVMLEIPVVKEKSSLVLGGRLTYSDWILGILDEESLSNSSANFYDVVAKYNHSINENNEIRATAYYSKDNFSITSDSIFRYSNRAFSLRWDHKFSKNNTGSILVTNSEYRFGIEFDGDSNDDFDLGYQNYESEVRLKMRSLIGDNHTLDYGVSGKYYIVDPGDKDPLNPESDIASISLPREQGLETGIFIADQWEITDRFLLDAGLRYSYYLALGPAEQRIYQEGQPRTEDNLIEVREFGDQETIETYGGPEVRVGGRYLFTPDFSIKASYNSTFQYIHTLSNNTTVSPTDTWKLSDINIEPQQAQQYSLGLFKNFNEKEIELSVEGFYKQSENLLDYKIGSQLLLNEQIETDVLQGDGKAYGVEFLLKKNDGALNGWLGYTYSRSFVKLDSQFEEEVVNNGEFFPSNFDKPHDFSLVANYRFTKRISASMNFVYQTGRPVTYPVGSYTLNNEDFVFYSDRNRFRIPDFYRLDLGFNLEGNHKKEKAIHTFWSFQIYNVLGRNNPYSVFFITEEGEIKALQSSIFAIPVPTLTFNMKF
ncbi:TonB-dependent receptor [Muricauda sp. JGD-17]|uniref:TonB-dependent receptor n=1 Tax=Flagellimonas ochracea TaxID=2696472 RepID=A0A964WW22_9FLAO|nr:TonB-dependent receptor [Allomuricauda ochracea]NAY90520.1 TonB-dependent receptor [Allomuricauda ochracea]